MKLVMKFAIGFLISIFGYRGTAVCQSNAFPILPPANAVKTSPDELLKKMEDYSYIIGKPFGEFDTIDLQGNPVTIDVLKGKVSVVAFWFSSCAPCVKAFPKINTLFEKYRTDSNFQVLSFTFDSKDEAKATAEKYGLKYNICLLSNEECHRLMFGKGFGCYFVVDETGKIIIAGGGEGYGGEDFFETKFNPAISDALSNLRQSLLHPQITPGRQADMQ